MIYHNLSKNTKYTYIYRAYDEFGTLRYKFAMPVSYRGSTKWYILLLNFIVLALNKQLSKINIKEIPLFWDKKYGEWEAHAWNSVKLLWPEVSVILFPDTMLFLMNELKRVEPKFKKLTGTFESVRIKAYKRMFRSIFDLIELREILLDYNGIQEPALVVWFKEKNIV